MATRCGHRVNCDLLRPGGCTCGLQLQHAITTCNCGLQLQLAIAACISGPTLTTGCVIAVTRLQPACVWRERQARPFCGVGCGRLRPAAAGTAARFSRPVSVCCDHRAPCRAGPDRAGRAGACAIRFSIRDPRVRARRARARTYPRTQACARARTVAAAPGEYSRLWLTAVDYSRS